MKKIIPFIIFLIIISTVCAISKNNIELFRNEKIVVGGKTITFLSSTSDKILLDIDGSKKIIKASGRTKVEGISFTIYDIFLDEEATHTSIKLNISMDYSCGNNKCEEEEDINICCRDCGCKDNETEICINNRCMEGNCATDKDCVDEYPCTSDKCIDYYCVNEPITSCKSRDGCCPKGCKYYQDKDCPAPPEKICEEGIIQHKSYCKNNSWNPLKEVDSPCENDYECFSSYCNYGKCIEIENVLTGQSLLPSPERKNLFQKLLDYILSLFS